MRSAFVKVRRGKTNAARKAWNRAVETAGLIVDGDGRLRAKAGLPKPQR